MTSSWAVEVSRSTADWASSGSVMMASHSTGAGICSSRPICAAGWAFGASACLAGLQGMIAIC
jgi:hypothetical protein